MLQIRVAGLPASPRTTWLQSATAGKSVIGQITQTISSVWTSVTQAFRDIATRSGPILPTNNSPPSNNVTTATTGSLNSPGSQPADYLLCCVDKGPTETSLIQNLLPNIETDRQLFQHLHSTYFGVWNKTLWLSLRTVESLALTRVRIPK